jgi:hypothetical protein
VAEVGDGGHVGARRFRCPGSDDAPVQRRPADCPVVFLEVTARGLALQIERAGAISQLPLQDREAEAARSRMHQEIGIGRSETGFFGEVGRDDLLDRLDLAEMVAAADAAQRFGKAGALQPGFGERRFAVAVPGLVEHGKTLGELVQPQLADGGVQPEQAHAAADVGADELRVQHIGQDGAAYGAVFAGMQIRHAGNRADAGHRSDLFELLQGLALHP